MTKPVRAAAGARRAAGVLKFSAGLFLLLRLFYQLATPGSRRRRPLDAAAAD